MSDNELFNILTKYVGDGISVTDIKIGLICHCGHHWGISLNLDDALIVQAQRMICLPCYQKSLHERNGRNGLYEYNNKKYY